MTMTDTEAKALTLVNANAINRRSDLDDAKHTELRCALLDAVQSQVATEARHAAEMREQAERFSEAALLVDSVLQSRGFAKTGPMRSRLAPFILPAPDPLVEVFDECFEQGMKEGETWSESMARKARTALASRGGKIVWEAGE